MTRMVLLGIAVVLLTSASAIHAGAPCCAGCGCQPCTKKVCRLKCEMKDVSKNVYECECEDFCVPGPSTCCKSPCTCQGKCCQDHKVWKPTCGCVRTRKVLVIKKEKTKKPIYKCVVEEVCTRCGHCANKLNYPESDDPAVAVAMAKNAGVQEIIGADVVPVSSRVNEPAEAPAVASRSALDRMLTDK